MAHLEFAREHSSMSIRWEIYGQPWGHTGCDSIDDAWPHTSSSSWASRSVQELLDLAEEILDFIALYSSKPVYFPVFMYRDDRLPFNDHSSQIKKATSEKLALDFSWILRCYSDSFQRSSTTLLYTFLQFMFRICSLLLGTFWSQGSNEVYWLTSRITEKETTQIQEETLQA